MSKKLAKMKADEREDRKRILLSATVNLLKSKDPGQVRIKDITGSVKISTATMYRYFNSKDAIFLEFLKRKADIFNKVENVTPSELMHYFNENGEVQNLLIYFSGNQRSLTPEQNNAFNAIRTIFFGITDGSAEINLFLINSAVAVTHDQHL